MHDQFERLDSTAWAGRARIGPSHPDKEYREARRWCIGQFGRTHRSTAGDGSLWVSTDSQWLFLGERLFWFRTTAQAVEFTMRWG
jgi:hypothetical protein